MSNTQKKKKTCLLMPSSKLQKKKQKKAKVVKVQKEKPLNPLLYVILKPMMALKRASINPSPATMWIVFQSVTSLKITDQQDPFMILEPEPDFLELFMAFDTPMPKSPCMKEV